MKDAAPAPWVAVDTIIGFGSLLSPKSARTTFPFLTNYRFVLINGYRRCFRHPAAIFQERGIANTKTLEIASLSAEPAGGCSFLACAFEIGQGKNEQQNEIFWENFREREEEFDLVECSFIELATKREGKGILCRSSSDESFISKWGSERFQRKYVARGFQTIWGWGPESGILPCAVYLRHCLLAVQREGVPQEVRDSFLDQTFLVDRSTTIRQYLETETGALVADVKVPESCRGRYSG